MVGPFCKVNLFYKILRIPLLVNLFNAVDDKSEFRVFLLLSLVRTIRLILS